jgi:uncharacterized protein YdeI (YjbR/CyaY-like superfamily)
MPTDPRVDAYIAEAAPFAQPILTHFRALLHAQCTEIEEAIRWRMPFFDYRGRPLANMAAFKAHAAFGFWDRAALTTGREGQGMGQFGKLRSIDDMPDDAVLIAKIREAMALIEAGDRPPRAARPPKPEATVPPVLADALAADAVAAATFNGFSPSCRREYCEWIADAKRDETRAKRVAETVALLRAGKKRNWKYEAC